MYNPEYTLNFPFLGTHFRVLRADMEQLWEEMVAENSTAHKDTTIHIPDAETKSVNIIEENRTKNTKTFEDKDERLPYWAELWPSSLALAKWLYENTKYIQGKNCLDLGCGLGFTAICGAWRGAHVLGVDYEERAIMLAKENALANKHLSTKKNPYPHFYEFLQKNHKKNRDSQSPLLNQKNIFIKQKIKPFAKLDFQIMDWRSPFTAPKSFDFIWAADIIYEHAFALPVLQFLDYALADTGKVWIAEPGRTIFNTFKNLIIEKNVLAHNATQQKTVAFSMKKVHFEKTHSLSAHIPSANVSIWEISRS